MTITRKSLMEAAANPQSGKIRAISDLLELTKLFPDDAELEVRVSTKIHSAAKTDFDSVEWRTISRFAKMDFAESVAFFRTLTEEEKSWNQVASPEGFLRLIPALERWDTANVKEDHV